MKKTRRVVRYFLHPVRIVVAFGQVLVNLGPVMQVQYPENLRTIINAMKPLMFSLRNLVQIDCWPHHSFWITWCFDVFFVPLLLFSAIALYYCHWTIIHRQDSEMERRNIMHSVRGYAFSVVFLVYPNICNNVFVIFRCRWLAPDEHYLEADYSVDCDSFVYQLFWWVAAIYAVLVPFGVPVYFWLIMRREEKREAASTTSLRNLSARMALDLGLDGGADRCISVVKQIKLNEDFSFLLDAYHPNYYYWECVDMLRKLTLIGLLVLVDRGSVAQICVAIIISFFFFSLHVKTWPYKGVEDNYLKASTEVALFIIVLMAIVLRTDLQGEAIPRAFYDDAVVLSLVVLVPMALVAAVVYKCKVPAPPSLSPCSGPPRQIEQVYL
jgi:hypothetical protein